MRVRPAKGLKGTAARWALTLVAYLATLVFVAMACGALVLVVAGPHAGLLPGWLEAVVLGLGWLLVLVLPLWAAHNVWHRFSQAAPTPVDSTGPDPS
ncbi:hypothetical protein [Hydrogenophaga defluvii]|uniref:DUF2842 domain-containing protein n=1 Tax=Hydrogenophaga defluvii TaxID=249410 RepID=A0ABW2SGZ2_9BURK